MLPYLREQADLWVFKSGPAWDICAECCYSEFARSEILKKKLGCLPWINQKPLSGVKPANVLDVGCGPILAWIGASVGQRIARVSRRF
jgi:hypothetical protein